MSDQALEDLKIIVSRLGPGMWLRLDRAAFPQFFGYGAAGKAAVGEFAHQNDCIALVKEEGGELSVEFMRAYAKRSPDA